MKILSFVALAFVMSLTLATPSHPAGDPKPEMAGQNYAQGEEKAREGKWAEAAALFRKVIEEDGQHYKAFNMLGYSLRKMGKAKEAIAAYNRALSIKPDYAPRTGIQGRRPRHGREQGGRPGGSAKAEKPGLSPSPRISKRKSRPCRPTDSLDHKKPLPQLEPAERLFICA